MNPTTIVILAALCAIAPFYLLLIAGIIAGLIGGPSVPPYVEDKS